MTEMATEMVNDSYRRLLEEIEAVTCHCGEVVTFGFDGVSTHHRGMCEHCDSVRCDVYPGECSPPIRGSAVHTETLSTIFLDIDNPGAGTLAEFPDGSWIVDIPNSPIGRETLRATAWAILEVIDADQCRK